MPSLDEMLFFSYLGCEALRLDAIAFIWRENGTSCENQEQSPYILSSFQIVALQISAPLWYLIQKAISASAWST